MLPVCAANLARDARRSAPAGLSDDKTKAAKIGPAFTGSAEKAMRRGRNCPPADAKPGTQRTLIVAHNQPDRIGEMAKAWW